MWTVARRPRWIAALALALVIAGIFAALSQWQLARSVSTGAVVTRDTETVVALSTMATPQSPVTDVSNGQLVSVTGSWNAQDFLIVSDRLNRGTSGYWVVGHFSAVPGAAAKLTAPAGASVGLAIAVGWTPSRAAANSALADLRAQSSTAVATITGRYFPGEGPQESDFQHGVVSTISPGQLINVWNTADAAGVYGGYLVDSAQPATLTRIDSPRPTSDVELNLLNIFYAIEWVVFACFAVFLWYRLVKDAWEREEEQALADEGTEREKVN